MSYRLELSMEIGSEFWISDIPSSKVIDRPFWLKPWNYAVLTSSGRGAISLLLQQVEPEFKTVLLPAYICESVILPFITNGYTCYFYDVTEDLTPLIDNTNLYPELDIFLHMGYFGFQTNNKLLDIIKQLKDKSTIIVEDITHTLFSQYHRFDDNDYYIASIRKWMGIPSGGFLASANIDINNNLKENFAFSDARKEALTLKAKYIYNNEIDLKKTEYRNIFAQAEDMLNEDLSAYEIDMLSKKIIYDINIGEMIKRRRSNFEILADGLRNIKLVRPIFKKFPDDICPLFYPVYINEKRNEVRKFLSEQNIYCPIHWEEPKRIENKNFKNASKIYKNIMSIPCDQRYGLKDMERIISVFKEIETIYC